MYISDVHIIYYIIVIALGFVIGHTLEYISKKIKDKTPIFTNNTVKEIIRNFLQAQKINYLNAGIVALLYTIVLAKFGIKQEFLENISLIKALVLIPIIILIIEIDLKDKIIPNRLTLLILETGIIFAFICSINNLFLTRDLFFGMIVGFAIYGIIALLGKIIAGKEVMGMGDVKLLAALGLYFGVPLTISISIIAFIIAGIIGIILGIIKKNKKNAYIPFGPSMGIATLICVLIPESIVISALLTIFTFGRYKIK